MLYNTDLTVWHENEIEAHENDESKILTGLQTHAALIKTWAN